MSKLRSHPSTEYGEGQTDKGHQRPFNKGKWKLERDGHRTKLRSGGITDEWRNRKLAMQGHSPNWKAGLTGSGLVKLSDQH